jgi:hypothetical protein
MTPTKSVDETNALRGTFVHAAVVTSLAVAELLFVAFSVMALGGHRDVLDLGFLLIPFATLVVWSSATVFYLVYRASGLLRTLKRLIGDARSSPSGKSVIWDDWLDIPQSHHH